MAASNELNDLRELLIRRKGGPGSGHRGHRGIPGHRGGSLPDAGGGSGTAAEKKGTSKAEAKKPDKTTPASASTSAYKLPKSPSRRDVLDDMDYEFGHYAKSVGVEPADVKRQLEDNLKWAVKDADVAVRVPVETLRSIAADGKLKNQFETGTSGGLVDPGVRKSVERSVIGVSNKVPDADRPIYGYVKTGIDDVDGGAKQYGNAEIILKPSVRGKVTITAGDSLDGSESKQIYQAASPLNKPSIESLGTDYGAILPDDYSTMKDPAQFWKSFGEWNSSQQTGSYIEAHIHGGISTSDISKVIIRGEADKGIIDTYKKLGIDVEEVEK